MNISACIVTYNDLDEAQVAAKSIIKNTKQNDLTLFLVDNASTDGTGEGLQKTDFGENTKVLALPRNLGFGSGHNKVLPLINSRYHAVINPDIQLTDDALSDICAYMDANPDIAMVTPALRFPDGREQYTAKRKPSLMALLSRQLPLPFLKNIEKHYLMLDEDLSVAKDVQFCSGCFFVIRTEIFCKMGGFDEDYFMYVEDADITQKALKYGRCVYLPSVSVVHAWHRDANKKFHNFFMQIKSMFIYWHKWGFKFI
ncbi:MAG: glycosyltransferase family 2 protein [Oscillospiraceae bacterium]